MKTYVVVKFHELALKGKNRPMFIRQLVDNLKEATLDIGVDRVRRGQMMAIIRLSSESAWPEVKERLGKCFGVSKFFRAYRMSPDLDKIKEFLTSILKDRHFESFRITANRAYKEFPMNSIEINEDLGAYVQRFSGARVDLTDPELKIFLDVHPREILVYFNEVGGLGGLPVGVSGKVTAMLSGGIDSPVAAWHMMKRGCKVNFVHFHSYPLVDTASMDKAEELVQLLNRFQYRSTLLLVPFSHVQQRIIVSAPALYRVVLYRRFMVRIAESLARQEGALSLVTGESLGQVSSQTLHNIAVVDAVAGMPVLRPLIGFNKQEIVDLARDIGTYETSIQPDQDCCTLFVPRHPVTRGNLETVTDLENQLPVEQLVQESLSHVERKEYRFPG